MQKRYSIFQFRHNHATHKLYRSIRIFNRNLLLVQTIVLECSYHDWKVIFSELSPIYLQFREFYYARIELKMSDILENFQFGSLHFQTSWISPKVHFGYFLRIISFEKLKGEFMTKRVKLKLKDWVKGDDHLYRSSIGWISRSLKPWAISLLFFFSFPE